MASTQQIPIYDVLGNFTGLFEDAAPSNPAAGASGQPPPPGGTAAPPATASSAGQGNASSITSITTPVGTVAAPVINAVTNIIGNQITQSNAGGLPNPPPAMQNINDASGRRVRLRPKPNAMRQILGNGGSGGGLMSPLYLTNGIVFPYQPTITWAQDVTYTALEIVHANQDFYSYSKTPALKLTVEGDFTVQNQTEGLYALACIQFLRTVTKMNFGSSDPNAGTPPPVLLFDAYGQWMFNALPVIVTQFSVTLPKDVDYVGILTANGTNNTLITASNPSASANSFTNINAASLTQAQGYAWLPAHFSISVQITVQNTPQRLRAFNLDKFRTGELLAQGTWV